MIPNSFNYTRAGSVSDAIAQLQQHGDGAMLLAGGHSLIPAMKYRLNDPTVLIDLSGITDLKSIRVSDDEIHIGALVTHRQVENSSEVQQACPGLAEAAAGIGDPQVRNRGTIGGSLAHADPSADYPALVLAMNARIDVEGPGGSRSISADDFFTGMFDTALGDHELITRIVFPAADRNTGTAYAKFSNPASRYALVGVAASVSVQGNTVTSARIAITGAAPSAFRATAMENALTGGALNKDAIDTASAHTPDPDELMSDLGGSAAYRAHLCGVMAKRAIEAAADRAR